MKPRHTAVLALLGWYVMVPPHRICVNCPHYFQPDPLNASLDKWEMVHRFDTLTKCEENLLWYQREERIRRWKLFKRPSIFMSLHMAAALLPTIPVLNQSTARPRPT